MHGSNSYGSNAYGGKTEYSISVDIKLSSLALSLQFNECSVSISSVFLVNKLLLALSQNNINLSLGTVIELANLVANSSVNSPNFVSNTSFLASVLTTILSEDLPEIKIESLVTISKLLLALQLNNPISNDIINLVGKLECSLKINNPIIKTTGVISGGMSGITKTPVVKEIKEEIIIKGRKFCDIYSFINTKGNKLYIFDDEEVPIFANKINYTDNTIFILGTKYKLLSKVEILKGKKYIDYYSNYPINANVFLDYLRYISLKGNKLDWLSGEYETKGRKIKELDEEYILIADKKKDLEFSKTIIAKKDLLPILVSSGLLDE